VSVGGALDPKSARQLAQKLLKFADDLEAQQKQYHSNISGNIDQNTMNELITDNFDILNLVEAEYESRRHRLKFIPVDLLGEPVWDILLKLLAHKIRGVCTSVEDLYKSSGVSKSTAIRYIRILEERGLIDREPHASYTDQTHVMICSEWMLILSKYLMEQETLFRGRHSNFEERVLIHYASQDSNFAR